ncbi:peptidase S16 [bacterium]|nr:peptidase S16 [bacterium]
MAAYGERDPLLDGYSGRAPLFPLPNVVLFPQALLPLHIFEPRYRQMTADALAGEGLIAMALLRPTSGEPTAIHDIVGLGKIVSHERLPDGRYHLVLRGLARARVHREVPTDRLYRLAELEILEDHGPLPAAQTVLARRLLRKFEHMFPNVKSHPVWTAVADSHVSLGMVCDLLASALPMAPEVAQHLMEDVDVLSRCRAVTLALEQIQSRQETPPPQETAMGFPPEFSVN